MLYGFHSVLAALDNPQRTVRRVLGTRNAVTRLSQEGRSVEGIEINDTKTLSRMTGKDAVHQGLVALCEPLPDHTIDELVALDTQHDCIVVLDQITDPHNVGAIIRSAAAFGASAIIMTQRHSPPERGVLAKAASGGLDHVAIIRVPNLAQALRQLGQRGYDLIGLDSEFSETIDTVSRPDKLALVLGAEGAGLRRLTRDLCDQLVRLPTQGPIQSLNVSNAAAVALFALRRPEPSKT